MATKTVRQPRQTKQSGPSAPRVSVAIAHYAVDGFVEEREQLFAIVDSLLGRLGEACNRGIDPPDGAPLFEWRLVQVMNDMLAKTELEDLMREIIDQSAREARHG